MAEQNLNMSLDKGTMTDGQMDIETDGRTDRQKWQLVVA